MSSNQYRTYFCFEPLDTPKTKILKLQNILSWTSYYFIFDGSNVKSAKAKIDNFIS